MNQGDLVAGRYRLLRPVGQGATGTVWAARHELVGREYALKTAAGASQDARDLFLREVRIIGKLRHPNIVDIADAGEDHGGLYLAMELLEGESLAQRIARAPDQAAPMSPGEALAVIAQVCRALDAAHASGVVHRDIKPENIFLANLEGGGVMVKLLDFGVSSARGITTSGKDRLYGTPAYMSPEQALGEENVDQRTDIWAVGVVLYEMLTGRHPFVAESYPALLPRIIDDPYPPLPPEIPAEVGTVVAGCLAKDRTDRYANAEALLEVVERSRAALHDPDDPSTHPGVFVETSMARRPLASSSSSIGEPAAAPRSRRSLALAILAVPAIIGIAVATTGVRRPPPAVPASSPVIPVTAVATTTEVASPVPAPAEPPKTIATPVPFVTASVTASAKAPPAPRHIPGGAPARGGKSSVSTVNSAGF